MRTFIYLIGLSIGITYSALPAYASNPAKTHHAKTSDSECQCSCHGGSDQKKCSHGANPLSNKHSCQAQGQEHQCGTDTCGKNCSNHGDKDGKMHVEFLKNKVGLSTEKIAKLHSLRKQFAEKKEALKHHLHDAYNSVEKLVESKSTNEALYEAALEKLRQAHNDLRNLREKKHKAMRDLLTAQQRAILMLQHSKHHHSGHKWN